MDMKDAKVKGSVLLDYVRFIRATKDKNWDKYLKKEDWDLLKSRILPAVWYPYEHFFRLGEAVFKEIAGENLEVARQFGRLNAETLFKGTYKGIMESVVSSGAGIMRFLERYAAMTPGLFNFSKISVEKVNERHAKLHITGELKPEEMLSDAYFAQLSGTVERVVELCGGKNPKVALTAKEWEGAPDTELDIGWE